MNCSTKWGQSCASHHLRTGGDADTRQQRWRVSAALQIGERAQRRVEPAPLRMVLGSQALDTTLSTQRKRVADFENQTQLAAATDFPAANEFPPTTISDVSPAGERGNHAGQRHIHGFELIPAGGTRLGPRVDLMGAYSKRTQWAERLNDLPAVRQESLPERSTPRNVARQLRNDEVDQLVHGYQEGATVYELADRFRIHRLTVSKHLHRAGVAMRRRGLHEQDLDAAVQLHREGCT